MIVQQSQSTDSFLSFFKGHPCRLIFNSAGILFMALLLLHFNICLDSAEDKLKPYNFWSLHLLRILFLPCGIHYVLYRCGRLCVLTAIPWYRQKVQCSSLISGFWSGKYGIMHPKSVPAGSGRTVSNKPEWNVPIRCGRVRLCVEKTMQLLSHDFACVSGKTESHNISWRP